jgi:hypothetical protein
MAALGKLDVAVTLEAAGFRIADDGLTYFLNESAETFAAAWRQMNCERTAILDAFEEAGPDVDRQLDAAMDVIHEVLRSIGIERPACVLRPSLPSASAGPADADGGPGLSFPPEPMR